jgi:putative tryptophan/tyrosine transport system substrate-binding protein
MTEVRDQKSGFSRGLALSPLLYALCSVGALLFALSFPVQAQQPAKVWRIGVVVSSSAPLNAPREEALRQGLREIGYVEGKNIVIEYRYAEGKSERWPDLAAELVRLKPDLIVAGGNGVTRAVQQATKTIPIVVGSAGDLVRAGVVASLARPGGNVTGSTEIAPDLSGKRLELLKEVVPRASKVAVVWYPLIGLTDKEDVAEIETGARQLGVRVQTVELRDPSEFENAYTAITKQQANAVIIISGSFTNFHRGQLLQLAAKHRLPSMCEVAAWTNEGCLVSYGPDVPYMWKRAAVFVDKILKGAKPADLPVEQPTKFELIINLKTAKQIGLTIPPNVLARADKVIK